MPDRPVIRDAAAADLDGCIATLAASHCDHPWDRWALTGSPEADPASAADVEAGLRRLTDVWFRLSVLPGGHGRVADDAASVAVWIPDDVAPLAADAAEALDEVADEILGDRAAIVAEVETEVRAHRPTTPHVVLASLGTHPGRQRQGLASALLTNHLHRLADRDVAAVVETSSPENVAFYERFGFEITATLDRLPHACPTTWVLTCPPGRATDERG